MSNEATRSIHLVDDPLFDEHRARGYHPERPERLIAARHAVESSLDGRVRRLAGRDATADEIARVHTARYVDELERHHGLFGALDDDTYLGPRSVAAAYRAAGGSVALVDALLTDASPADSGSPLGVALVRPPGHHARPDGGMGFCLVNNVAIAAAHAMAKGIRRVAIVDWDVHHGNGTQDAFYADPRVLFVSIHQYPFYPGTGAAAETGEGEGEGFNVNVPLSPNAGDATYRSAFDRIVAPVLDQFAPELILVSAGFDAHARDPLAGMVLTARGFGELARTIRTAADAHAKGRVGVFLEGGYDLEGLESSLAATLSGLTSPAPPPAPVVEERSPLSSRHGLELESTRQTLTRYWRV